MNREQIIQMAIESELIDNKHGWCGWVEHTDLRPFIERFAALVAEHEREAICKLGESNQNSSQYVHWFLQLIRARGKA
jgi:hypothetical protein